MSLRTSVPDLRRISINRRSNSRLAQLRKKISDQRAHLDELESHMYVQPSWCLRHPKFLPDGNYTDFLVVTA